MCIEDSYVPADLAPGLTEADWGGSLYEVLENRFHTRLNRAEQRIQATVLSAAQAGQLESVEFGPAFDVTRIGYDARSRRIEFARSIYRGDRYFYDLTVYR